MQCFCNNCQKEFEPRRASTFNCDVCIKKLANRKYKNKMRHGGKREELIKENGLICYRCGKTGNRFSIVTHHIGGDSENHRKQVNLCRSCHFKIHDILGYRNDIKRVRELTKEMVENALKDRELENACEILGITRSALYKIRRAYNLPMRKNLS